MDEIENIYSEMDLYDYANMYLADNTKFFAEFFIEFNKVDWYVLFHRSTSNPFIYENYKAIICLNQQECLNCIKKYKLGPKVYFQKISYDKHTLLEEFFRMGIKELDIFIINKFLQLSIIHYQSKVSKQIIQQKGIFAELFSLVQMVITNTNQEYEFCELKRLENKCYDKMLNTDFYCKSKINEDAVVIEQLIDKIRKTVWFACYTDIIKEPSDKWQINKMPLIDLINYVNNANGIIINPYEENIRLSNNIIIGIKKYLFRRKVIDELLHKGSLLPFTKDTDKIKSELFKLFSEYTNIKRVYISIITNKDKEYYLLMLDLTDDEGLFFGKLSKECIKVLNTNRLYMVKVWDIDEVYVKQSKLIYSKFS
jgi:hypothetical protein